MNESENFNVIVYLITSTTDSTYCSILLVQQVNCEPKSGPKQLMIKCQWQHHC